MHLGLSLIQPIIWLNREAAVSIIAGSTGGAGLFTIAGELLPVCGCADESGGVDDDCASIAELIPKHRQNAKDESL